MTALTQYAAARAALAQAQRVDQVIAIRDEMEHVKLWGRQVKDRTLVADANEIQLRAERRLGELLLAAEQAGQLKEGRPRKTDSGNGSAPEPFSRVTLKEAGIDKKLSARSQRTASISERAFEAMVESTRAKIAGGSVVVIDPVRTAAKEADSARRRAEHDARTQDGCTVEDLHALAASGARFGAILADPGWKFLARGPNGEGRSAGQHYTTTGLDVILRMPVLQLAAPDCVLFLWMVDWNVAAALEVIANWGFEHKTTAFTWVKQTPAGDGWHMGQGYWTRANPEDCWLATRGNPQRLDAGVRQLIVAPVMEHSRKPDEVHDRIERLVAGPYLELNARRPRAGWTVWGDEIPRPEFLATNEAAKSVVPPYDPQTGELLDVEASVGLIRSEMHKLLNAEAAE